MGATLVKRKGEELDAYVWSYQIPNLIWEMEGQRPEFPFVCFAFFDTTCPDGPGVAVSIGSFAGSHKATSAEEAEAAVTKAMRELNRMMTTATDDLCDDQLIELMYAHMADVGWEMS